MIKEDCIFCKIANGQIPSNFIYETKDVVAFDDLNPQAPIHTLIIPREHYDNLSTIDNPELLRKLMIAAQEVAKIKGVDNYRIVINTGEQAGQSVFHIHIHLLAGRPLLWPPG